MEGIISGEISSIAELKALFKAEAKRTHPDSADRAGSGGSAQQAEEVDTAAFIRMRTQYEDALERLTAGYSRHLASGDPGGERFPGTSPDPYAALKLLLKRGFPKRPRHQKEILRYAYARLSARSALGRINTALPTLFDEFEERALSPNADPKALSEALRLLSELLKARLAGAESLEVSVRMELTRLAPTVSLGDAPMAGVSPGESKSLNLDAAAAVFLWALIGPEERLRGSR